MAAPRNNEIVTNGQSFLYKYRRYQNNDILLIGSSLLKEFYNSSCDVLCIPGCRAEDVPAAFPVINLHRYKKIALMFGANGLVCRTRNNVIREAQSVQTIIHHIINVINLIREVNVSAKIYFLGLPPRLLPSYEEISAVNKGLQRKSLMNKSFEFIGTSSKLANEGVIADDKIHLNNRGYRYLNDIIKKRIIYQRPWFKTTSRILTSTIKWAPTVITFQM